MYDCIKELAMTSRNLSAYDAAPGQYQARFKVGSYTQTQDFEIKIDPRIETSLPNAAAGYAEREQLSSSLYVAATAMSKGVRDIRKVKQQLDFVLSVTDSEAVMDGGKALNDKIDAWIATILQKELRTQQNNYQFEARLLVRYKNFLNDISDGNVPVTQGMRDVTRDYLQEWKDAEADLQAIKNTDIQNYNGVLKGAGLPEIYWP